LAWKIALLSITGLFVVYLLFRLIFYAIFRSYFEAKFDFFKRRIENGKKTKER